MFNPLKTMANGNLDIDECVQSYFDSLTEVKPLTKEEERELFILYKEKNDINARNKLIVSNLKYASQLASSFRGRGIPYYDLISEANSGLMEAIDKFDLDKDVKLISYAKWWIMQRIQAALAKKNKMPYSELPTDNEAQLTEDEDGLSYKDGRKQTDEETFISSGDIYDDSCNAFLDKIFSNLTMREVDMIDMYYGRNYNKQYTLDEIGAKYSLTKERVRQIINKAFIKIRSEAMLVEYKYL